MPLPWLDPHIIGFPPVKLALQEPNGLLAAGGDLSLDWLLCAYRHGIFPWYEAGQPLLWWSPNPRLIITPDSLKISRSLRKLINKHSYEVSIDSNFAEVIQHCAQARRGSDGTWITAEMQAAYIKLHEHGYAHSVEVHAGTDLVGGLYGVALGKVFFGESMFSREDNTSKLALVYLVEQLRQWGFELIDCQLSSEHLFSLGAMEISRDEFIDCLKELLQGEDKIGKWQLDSDFVPLSYEY
ncbi:MAG: leucyl/phenylalanyl-tRNA--protein transferase [Gammaproteobacteria bacterium]|nr:leucyl/phenylalanyl-tRNA--protein transferase [Gammaproteobacteria bacterium]MDD9895954.1 leucyl/phenylalanyl-tRNA--protein transferase [Gammaproteobacteria bacterium]